MKNLGAILCFLLGTLALYAQTEPTQVNENPYGVIYNHLYWLQPDSYEPAEAARSFPAGTPEVIQLAIQLKQVLDGSGLYVDINRLPTDSTYFDSLANAAIYFIDRDHPLIYVERIDDTWYYSRTTIEAIPGLHHKLYPFGTRLATYFEAPVWQFQVLSIELWKWLALVVLLLTAFVLFYIFNYLSTRIFRPILRHRLGLSEAVQDYLRRFSRLFALLISVRFLNAVLPMVQLPPAVNAFMIKGLGVLSIFFIIFIITQIVSLLFHYLRLVTQKTSNTLDDQLLPVLKRVAMIVVWTLGAFYILDFLDVNVTALLAGISIGGLAIALAAQDTVKNFFGSIMIFIDRPFQIGDWVHFGDVDGVVEEVGVRSTRIRTFANSITYVPNALLANEVVDNMGLRQYRRFKTEIGVTYDTPPAAIDAFVKGIREIVRQHPTARKDAFEVHLNSFGASSLNILLYMFFEAPNWTAELEGRHQVMYAIMVLAEDLGVRFAFPTQTIHVEEFPGNGATTPAPLQMTEAETKMQGSLEKIRTYFRDKQAEGHGLHDKIKPLGGE